MQERQTILVVDDSPDIHRLVEVRLRDLDLKFLHAQNGEGGIAQAREHDPNLILLDVGMPGIDGFETCRRLKEDPATHDIPVVFLTGSSESEKLVRAFAVGAADYINKPFNPAELRARINAALHTQELIDMLAEQASLDALTGLHNRRYFEERLGQEIEICNRHDRDLGLLLLDVDYFKQINDTAGHPVGDHVLKAFATHLRGACRESDIPCRQGGDEFALILPEANATTTLSCGQRVLQGIRDDQQLQELLDRDITASIGGASTRGPYALRVDDLIRRADHALYNTKERGRNGLTVAGLPAKAA